ncbi:MAG: aspartate aminotransferase family protein [Gammaproteobacteria bacterium]|nr:aspartate aminotransferase family protein [Gammaproteobacteria bacterium]
MKHVDIEDRYGIQFCNRQQLVIERGKGSLVWDTKGARYLDFTSGWGVTCLGHAHPVVVESLAGQSQKLMQNPNSGFTYSPARAELLALLAPLLPGSLSRLFFVNSGAEANDAAIKLARKVSGRRRVISTLDSFHGRTLNTLSVSGGEANVCRYPPRYPHNEFVPFGELAPLEQALNEEVAALIVEPIQGEGGVRIPPSNYLPEVSRLCKEQGVLLIIDEIQTGFSRTGMFFAMQSSEGVVEADFLTVGKGIAGGFPFAGLAITEEIAASIEKGDHGGTYCGNPLGCAVATAVVQFLIENDIAGQVESKGRLLLAGLQRLRHKYPQLVRDARGRGLLTALELANDELVAELTAVCQQHGLLITPTRNAIVRLIPDLLVSEASIEEALATLDHALDSMESRVAAAS